jgi:hypothetical protein
MAFGAGMHPFCSVKAVFTSSILQNGQHFSSYQILQHMHKALNID